MIWDTERRLRRLEGLMMDTLSVLLLTPEKMQECHPQLSLEKAAELLAARRDEITAAIKEMKDEGI